MAIQYSLKTKNTGMGAVGLSCGKHIDFEHQEWFKQFKSELIVRATYSMMRIQSLYDAKELVDDIYVLYEFIKKGNGWQPTLSRDATRKTKTSKNGGYCYCRCKCDCGISMPLNILSLDKDLIYINIDTLRCDLNLWDEYSTVYNKGQRLKKRIKKGIPSRKREFRHSRCYVQWKLS